MSGILAPRENEINPIVRAYRAGFADGLAGGPLEIPRELLNEGSFLRSEAYTKGHAAGTRARCCAALKGRNGK